MTKLRGLLEECGIDGSTALTSAFGCYTLTLPGGAWIDVDAAVQAVERAETAFASGDLDEARAQAATAAELARQVFLPGEDGSWVAERRRDLHDVLVRALDCLRDAALAGGELAEAVRRAAQVVELEPFRESSYRGLMQAHVAAGNPAEALRVYERCRRFLADELGAYPSAESEALYLEILRSSRASPPAEADDLRQLARTVQRSRKVKTLVASLALAAAAAAVFVLTRHDQKPVELLPTSLVRLDPVTFKPSQVVRIGPRADLVVAAGGYVWVTHGSLRYTDNHALRDAGDRILTRIDPSTGESRVVGGGLAPCGMTADPSGDVWVANCYTAAPHDTVVRVDARTLEFAETWRTPAGAGFFRGMAYGGGQLWLADPSGATEPKGLTQVDPRTGALRAIQLPRHASALSWSDGYGDLWATNFEHGSAARVHAESGDVETNELTVANPGPLVVHGDSVWVGDWNVPVVVRLPAVGSAPPRRVALSVLTRPAGVTSVAAGAGAVWAAVPSDHAVWRVDEKTNRTTRVGLTYAPWGVAVTDDGIWVALRATDAA